MQSNLKPDFCAGRVLPCQMRGEEKQREKKPSVCSLLGPAEFRYRPQEQIFQLKVPDQVLLITILLNCADHSGHRRKDDLNPSGKGPQGAGAAEALNAFPAFPGAGKEETLHVVQETGRFFA